MQIPLINQGLVSTIDKCYMSPSSKRVHGTFGDMSPPFVELVIEHATSSISNS